MQCATVARPSLVASWGQVCVIIWVPFWIPVLVFAGVMVVGVAVRAVAPLWIYPVLRGLRGTSPAYLHFEECRGGRHDCAKYRWWLTRRWPSAVRFACSTVLLWSLWQLRRPPPGGLNRVLAPRTWCPG